MSWSMYHCNREVVTIRLYDKNYEDINFVCDERPPIFQNYPDRKKRLASCTLLMSAKYFSVRGVKYYKKRKFSCHVFLLYPSTMTQP